MFIVDKRNGLPIIWLYIDYQLDAPIIIYS